MARRKQSAFEDLIDIVALLPWWAAVVIALSAWVGFGMLINAETTRAASASTAASLATHGIRDMLFTVARFLIPTVSLFGGIASYIRKRHRSGLLQKLQSNNNGHAIEDLSWRDFELVVSEAFRVRGFRVSERGGSGPDGGIDIELVKNGERFLVQCKHWKTRTVGVGIVRELFGVIAAEGAQGGFVICSGAFTKDAINFAKGKTIELIGEDGLTTLFKDGAEAARSQRSVESEKHTAGVKTNCPKCGGAMVMRRARKGPSEGASFWGCERFPKCRGTRPF